MKTNKLKGAALDWAVAKCEGEVLGEDLFGLRPIIAAPAFTQQFKPSTDWSQGGPIIEREKLTTDFFPDGCSKYGCEWTVQAWDEHGNCYAAEMGETILIAAMRCYVASKLGDEVEIPEELK